MGHLLDCRVPLLHVHPRLDHWELPPKCYNPQRYSRLRPKDGTSKWHDVISRMLMSLIWYPHLLWVNGLSQVTRCPTLLAWLWHDVKLLINESGWKCHKSLDILGGFLHHIGSFGSVLAASNSHRWPNSMPCALSKKIVGNLFLPFCNSGLTI